MMRRLLARAIADTVELNLGSSTDKIVRTVPSREWPVQLAMELLAERTDIRVLRQKPFDALDDLPNSTADAGEATAWRNNVARDFAVVLLGYSGSNLDAGLHDVKVIDAEPILDRWKELVLDSFSGIGDLDRPNVKGLMDGLFDALLARRLGANEVVEYLEAIAAQKSFESVTTEMWRLSAFLDSHVLDTGQARTRLERNLALVDRLKQGEEQLIQKLRRAARAESIPAKRVLEYLESSDPSNLRSVHLDDIESLLFGNGEAPRTPVARPFDLFDLLNYTYENKDAVRTLIIEFQESILESPFEPLSGRLTLRDDESVDVRVQVEFKDLSPEDHDLFQLDNDPIVTAAHLGEDAPIRLGEANDRKLPLSQWVERVGEFASTEEFVSLRKRIHFFQHVPSLEDAFTLLLLMPRVREDVLQYCQSWQTLVSEIGESNAPDARSALLSIQSLEVLLEATANPQWLALSLLHPYRLEPLARVAEYCDTALVDSKAPPEKLGDAAKWMLDRSIPAYPAYYREQSVFHLASASRLLQYRLHSRAALPVLSDARGLKRMLQSIARYSPWLNRGVSVLVIDPPSGGGVGEALKALKSSLASDARLLVYHAQRTGSYSDGLTNYDGEVIYLPSDWRQKLDRLPLVDIVLIFSPESETSHMSTTEAWAAAPGTHMVLQLSISKTDDVFDTKARPRIDVKPSAESGIVNAILDLYKELSGGRAPHAAIQPLDSDEERELLATLQKRTDWTITARPGPFGLATNSGVLAEFGYVGRAASGRYLVSVFAGPQVYGVRRYIEHVLRDTPVAAVDPADMASRLIDLARDSARSLVDAAHQPVPSLGELLGLDLASATSGNRTIAVSLAMDDLGWTRAWLGQRLRPDFVVVLFDLDQKKISVRVVECKTSESPERVQLRASEPVVAEALGQVAAAADVMNSIFNPGSGLAEDLQFSSFIEHLFAVLLNDPVMRTDSQRELLQLANGLAERSITPTIERWVFVTQPAINQEKEETSLAESTAVWLGAPEVHRLLKMRPSSVASSSSIDQGFQATGESEQTEAILGAKNEDAHHAASMSSEAPSKPIREAMGLASSVRVEDDALPEVSSKSDAILNSESQNLARDFILAMRLHNADVADPSPQFVRVGPSLITIGVQLAEGSSIQPIRSRLGDIAREVGLGNREKELWVENSSEPGVIQVLVPRPDRVFPPLPMDPLGPVQDDAYVPLYMGQTVEGKDYISAVEKWPHILVAGTTGSGKTTLLQSLLTQFTRLRPEEVEVVIADGKGDTDYLGLVPNEYFPEELVGVQLGPDKAKAVADWAVDELDRRSKLIHEIVGGMAGRGPAPKAADIYKTAIANGDIPSIRPLVIVIDEFADIMLASKKQEADGFMSNVQRIAQIGRSRLMHILLATQRPDKNTIRGAVRANFDARIAMRLPTAADSMTILGSGGAERLMNHGDLLFRASSGQVVRLQGYSSRHD